MAELLKGAPLSEKIIEEIKDKERKTLAIVRVGENPDDLSYERGAIKKASFSNVEIVSIVLEKDVTNEEYLSVIDELNSDEKISGILILRPLPKTLDEELIRNRIDYRKDVDAATDISLSSSFLENDKGFSPCTAEAVIRLLDFYQIDVAGKNVCIIGRSLVIGKPVSMMLLKKNATVTICHSKSKDIAKIARNSDILITSVGKLNYITKDFVNSNQIVIDVGINFNPETNKIQGDSSSEIFDIVKMITPTPGGVGAVTSTILMEHVKEANL